MTVVKALNTISSESKFDFDWLFGQNTLDDEFDVAIVEQSQVEPKLWQ